MLYHYRFYLKNKGGEQKNSAQNSKISIYIGANDQTRKEITPFISGKKKIYGIDIAKYRYDKFKKFPLLGSISYAFINATEGIKRINPNFYKEWGIASQHQLYKGAYHFYRNNANPIKQADFFYKTIQPVINSNSLPPVLDVEALGFSDTNYAKNSYQERVLKFLNRIEKLTKRTPIIYTNYNFGEKFFTKKEFSKFPLWIADYNNSDTPRIPDIWKDTGWLFWQKTNRYDVDTTLFDLDLFNGNANQMQQLNTQ
ncbi:MAG: hypothetical protein GKR88_01800 [Flavobacteriaceae bacterium]|nr:MAG: hypothetical protein GKR88_01800 [Flavobacteriaceae bacterium]